MWSPITILFESLGIPFYISQQENTVSCDYFPLPACAMKDYLAIVLKRFTEMCCNGNANLLPMPASYLPADEPNCWPNRIQALDRQKSCYTGECYYINTIKQFVTVLIGNIPAGRSDTC